MIGGAAGAVPPLVGWAAATGHVGIAALAPVRDRLRLDAAALLGARAADQGQLRGREACRCCRSCAATARRRGRSSSTRVVLVGATLLPWGWGGAGPLYVVCALALGAVFVWLAERLRRDTTPRRAMLLFHYSLLYLALLFAALALDAVIADGSRARTQERPPRLDAVRRLPAALRRLDRGRVPVPPLQVVDGIWLARPRGGRARASRSRSRICSTRPG